MAKIPVKKVKKSHTRSLVFALVIVVLATLGWEAGIHADSVQKTVKLATTKQPETFTELFFNYPKGLPTAVSINKPYQFAYSITNHLAATHIYTYQTWYVLSGQKVITSTGQITLVDGQTASLELPFTAALVDQTYQVGVSLPELNQQIAFRVAS